MTSHNTLLVQSRFISRRHVHDRCTDTQTEEDLPAKKSLRPLTYVGGGTAEQLVTDGAVSNALDAVVVAVLEDALQLSGPDDHRLVRTA